MMPEEAKAVDAAEFAADCAHARERAHSLVAKRQREARESLANWLGRAPPTGGRFYRSSKARPGKTLTVDGETHTVMEWADLTGLSKGTIEGRLRMGWSHERAVREPAACHVRRDQGVGNNSGASAATGARNVARDFSQLEISD